MVSSQFKKLNWVFIFWIWLGPVRTREFGLGLDNILIHLRTTYNQVFMKWNLALIILQPASKYKTIKRNVISEPESALLEQYHLCLSVWQGFGHCDSLCICAVVTRAMWMYVWLRQSRLSQTPGRSAWALGSRRSQAPPWAENLRNSKPSLLDDDSCILLLYFQT